MHYGLHAIIPTDECPPGCVYAFGIQVRPYQAYPVSVKAAPEAGLLLKALIKEANAVDRNLWVHSHLLPCFDVEPKPVPVGRKLAIQCGDIHTDHIGRINEFAIAVAAVIAQVIAHGLLRLCGQG